MPDKPPDFNRRTGRNKCLFGLFQNAISKVILLLLICFNGFLAQTLLYDIMHIAVTNIDQRHRHLIGRKDPDNIL